jgi:translation initiation factor 1 (eIF-1/SUI1)
MGRACGICRKEENRIQDMVKKHQRHVSFERQRVNGRATVTWVLNLKMWEVLTGLIWLKIETSAELMCAM